MVLRHEGRNGQTLLSAAVDVLLLLVISLASSLVGMVAGAYIGVSLCGVPDPGDGPAMISASIIARFTGACGLLSGPVSMVLARTRHPRLVERVFFSVFTPIVTEIVGSYLRY